MLGDSRIACYVASPPLQTVDSFNPSFPSAADFKLTPTNLVAFDDGRLARDAANRSTGAGSHSVRHGVQHHRRHALFLQGDGLLEALRDRSSGSRRVLIATDF